MLPVTVSCNINLVDLHNTEAKEKLSMIAVGYLKWTTNVCRARVRLMEDVGQAVVIGAAYASESN